MIQWQALSSKSIGTMASISENDFRGVDLNLMISFLVLMRERSVSRAAEKLFLGQPAVSGALSRLRQLFGDELLIRTADGMVPTTRALALEAAIGPAVEQLQRTIFSTPVFDPGNAERLFLVGMPDWVELWLMPGLVARLQVLAPRVRVAFKETNPFSASDMLEDDEIELAVVRLPTGPQWQRERMVLEMGFRCVYDPVQITLAGDITLEQYTALPHLLVSYRAAFESATDTALATQGLRRNVCYTTPRFSSVPGVLGASPMISTVPDVLARRWEASGRLRSCPVPVALPGFTISMAWHARRDNDPALQWLMGLIKDIAAEP